MEFDRSPVAVTDPPEAIAAAVADADVPPLLVAVAHLTGDLSILEPDLAPDQLLLLDPSAGYTPEKLERARALAAEALARHAAAGSPPAPRPSADDLRAMIRFLVGDAADGDYHPVLVEELALGDEDLRAPTWTKDEVAPDTPFTVVIVGAGMSGILLGHRLVQAGVPFVILEKNDEVGGTWFENTYPGCRVDVPSTLYSYSFAQTGDWPGFFSSQAVLLDYFRTCVDRFGLRPHIRLGTEVLDATFDDATQRWTIRTRSADGTEASMGAEAVVSAVGQLNRPNLPDIEGRDRFEGEWFHSARWPADLELAGKRVAIIGTGASAAQFIPPVAEAAEHLVVFQRTPPWLIPTDNYQDDVPGGVRWLLRHLPEYARWDRLWMFWRMHEGLLPLAEVDPEWPHQDRSVSAMNDFVREMFTAFIDEQFPDPELRDKVLPKYPPVAKRVVRDNGILGRTYARDDVELVTEPIAEITPGGVRTVDGRHHEVDVLIYGTGFAASEFLTPMSVVGRGGADLHDQWAGDARAYLGITVPSFPNLFLMYGPNTNIVINGSIIFFSECEAHYVVESIRMLLESGKRSMEPRVDVHDAYNEQVDEANRRMAWGAAEVNSWYKNPKGRVAQNWPFSLLEYWQQTRRPDADDYVLR